MKDYLSGVSVIICSYNGASRIADTLCYLSRQQTTSTLSWEIILIDNASTDNLQQIAQQTWNSLQSPVSFRIVHEPASGKDNAIDQGFKQAKYSYIIICDDDNWLAENYVQTAFDHISKDSSIGMLGGLGIPVFEASPPDWFDSYLSYYAVGEQNKTPGNLTTSKGFLWGAGAVVNVNAYQKLAYAGFQRIITYHSFPTLARGEDIELCLAIRLAGYQISYEPKLIFQHYISADKLQWKYLLKLTREGGLMGPLILPYQELIKNKSLSNRFPWLRLIYRRNRRLEDIRNAISLFFINKNEGSKEYQVRLAHHYYFLGIIQRIRDYKRLYEQVACLKTQLQRNNA